RPQVFRFRGMDRQRRLKVLQSTTRELDEAAKGMDLLTEDDAAALHRPVAAPVADRGPGAVARTACRRPLGQHDRLQRRLPRSTARRYVAARQTDPQADGGEVGMTLESDVDALDVPQLVERRIEIEVHAPRYRLDELRVAQHSRDVDQEIAGFGELGQR